MVRERGIRFQNHTINISRRIVDDTAAAFYIVSLIRANTLKKIKLNINKKIKKYIKNYKKNNDVNYLVSRGEYLTSNIVAKYLGEEINTNNGKVLNKTIEIKNISNAVIDGNTYYYFVSKDNELFSATLI